MSRLVESFVGRAVAKVKSLQIYVLVVDYVLIQVHTILAYDEDSNTFGISRLVCSFDTIVARLDKLELVNATKGQTVGCAG